MLVVCATVPEQSGFDKIQLTFPVSFLDHTRLSTSVTLVEEHQFASSVFPARRLLKAVKLVL